MPTMLFAIHLHSAQIAKQVPTRCQVQRMTWDLFWGFLLGYVVGVLYMAYRSNTDSRTTTE